MSDSNEREKQYIFLFDKNYGRINASLIQIFYIGDKTIL